MIPNGTIHKTPKDFKDKLSSSSSSLETWKDITPLARNEWICWISSAKKDDTRKSRIRIAIESLKSGKRRPCCWAGCPHR